MIRIKGSSAPQVMAIAGGLSARERLSAIGDDLVGLWVVGASPARMPGASVAGDVVTDWQPVAARQLAAAVAPTGSGRGARLTRADGVLALANDVAAAEVNARPINTQSFGLGVLIWINPATITTSLDYAGNGLTGGGHSPIFLRRMATGNYIGMMNWAGIASTWIADQTREVKTQIKIMTGGWYCVMADVWNGNSGLAIDDRAPAVAPFAGTPTLSSIFLGGTGATFVSQGAIAAGIIVDGPLAQSPTRRAQWRSYCADVLTANRA